MITAIIPVRNEGELVERAVTGLRRQTRPPERILVMSHASTDGTVEAGLRVGAEVLLTADDDSRRSSALNQALASVRMGPEDLVLVLDTGAELPENFVAEALCAFEDRNVGAVAAPRGAVPGTAALLRWTALQDVHRAFGRYYDEEPVTGQGRLALDLETVGWRLAAPVGTRPAARTPVPVTRTPATIDAGGVAVP